MWQGLSFTLLSCSCTAAAHERWRLGLLPPVTQRLRPQLFRANPVSVARPPAVVQTVLHHTSSVTQEEWEKSSDYCVSELMLRNTSTKKFYGEKCSIIDRIEEQRYWHSFKDQSEYFSFCTKSFVLNSNCTTVLYIFFCNVMNP